MLESRIAAEALSAFALACPVCRSALDIDGSSVHCRSCGQRFSRVDGVWRFLPEARYHAYAAFLEEYQTVRRAEGWGTPSPAYFLTLPFVSHADPRGDVWRVRARSYRAFLDRVLVPLEGRRSGPLTILDLGAGNCWLAHRLASRGHKVLAIDLSTDALDGLAAFVWYAEARTPEPAGSSFVPVQAEFDRLPLAARQVDLAIFNGSLHYSTNYSTTLREALRVIRVGGQIVVLDSPFYSTADSGRAMVRSREAGFEETYGFKGDRLPTEGFLTFDRLRGLGAALDLGWEVVATGLRWRLALKRWRARIRGRREPAAFPLVIGRLGGAPSPRASWPSPARDAARLFLRARRKLFQRGRYDRLVVEVVHGTPILVLPGVFNPKILRTGEFLVRALEEQPIQSGSTVLDLGTGSGVGAVFAGPRARRVVAVDINPEAVRCAKLNLLLHHLYGHCETREGDLFSPVEGERFDLILFNPPFYRGEPRGPLDYAWRGTDVIERFAAQVGSHLTPDGSALVVLSSDGEAAAFLHAVRANGLFVELVSWRDFVNETLAVYRIKPAPPEGEVAQPC